MIKKPEGPFEILINNEQRLLLIKLIRTALRNPVLLVELNAEPTNEVYPNTKLEEAMMLKGMLCHLPQTNEETEEQDSPFPRRRMLHGFCL